LKASTSLPSRCITLHTDGACSGNPGPGGWGAVLCSYAGGVLTKQKDISGSEINTTNNRMELSAAINGLRELNNRCIAVFVFSDSKYVIDGITSHITNWKTNGWKTAGKKPVKNTDLWRELDELSEAFDDLNWKWIKGHAGVPHNERADDLARQAIETARTS
jgi:ribonuclease HI